jgi:hypothetical protein
VTASSAGLDPTHLRRYYDALQELFEEEQTVLAEAHAKDASLLAHRLEQTLKVVENYEALTEPLIGQHRKPLPERLPVDRIRSTPDFVSQIAHRRRVEVADAQLAFHYVAREVSPLRTTGTRRAPRRALDLLLVSDDHLPIAAELKIRADSPTYPALIQALMYASELVTASQRARLRKHFPEAGFAWPNGGPFIDIYLIAFESPPAGRFRQRSFDASRRIAEGLFDQAVVQNLIRRIAYLDAANEGGALIFREEFSFPDYR